MALALADLSFFSAGSFLFSGGGGGGVVECGLGACALTGGHATMNETGTDSTVWH